MPTSHPGGGHVEMLLPHHGDGRRALSEKWVDFEASDIGSLRFSQKDSLITSQTLPRSPALIMKRRSGTSHCTCYVDST